MRCALGLGSFAGRALALCLTLAGLPLMAGCSRDPTIPTLTLIFELFPHRNVSAVYLAHNSVLPIQINPGSLACDGAGEFKEYRPTAPVQIYNERGDVIGSGLLGPGRIMQESTSAHDMKLFRGCRFETRIPLKAPARIYRLSIANGKYKKYVHVSQLRALGGVLRVDLG